MNGNTKIKRILLIAAGVVLLTGIVIIMWLRGVFLPRWVTWKTGAFDYGSKAEVVLNILDRQVLLLPNIIKTFTRCSHIDSTNHDYSFLKNKRRQLN